VTGRVHAEEAVGEVALHAGGKIGKCLVVVDEIGDLGVGGPVRGGIFGDVAAETARVVAQAGELGIRGVVGENRGDWAEIYFPATRDVSRYLSISARGRPEARGAL
jgi:hypothetical protein